MKRGWKIFWIVCAVCLAIGFVCCAASFVMGVTAEAIENCFPNGFGFVLNNDDYDDSYDYDEDDYNDSAHHPDSRHDGETDFYETGHPDNIIEGSKRLSFQNANAVDMEVWSGDITVMTDASLSNEITIDTDNINKKLRLRCYMNGNELKIVSAKRVNVRGGKIVLCLPEGISFEEVSVGLTAGRLHIRDVDANELSVDVGAGEGIIDNFRAYEAALACGAGSLTAAGAAEGEVDIECGVGEIVYTAQGKETDYNYDIECGVGEIVCGENSFSGLGREQTIDHHSSREMNINCGIGTVAVNFSEQ